MKKYYNPKRWSLGYALQVSWNLTKNIKNTKKFSDLWFYYKLRREIEHTKKHLILMDMLLEKYKKRK